MFFAVDAPTTRSRDARDFSIDQSTHPSSLYNQIRYLLPSFSVIFPRAPNISMKNATSDPADWTQFFHDDALVGDSRYPPHPFMPASVSAESTVVTTVPAASGRGGGMSGAERHVGKAPSRKRSRSSRRAPTTLLNTDAANFRAMVQQFTGVSTGQFTASYGTGGQSSISFGFGSGTLVQQPEVVRLGNQRQQQQYQFQPPEHQQQREESMRFSADGNGVVEEEEGMISGFFFDGMGAAGQLVVPGQMGRDGGGGYSYF